MSQDNSNTGDEDLPLHAEAQVREKWRGGETILRKGSEDAALPASEVDNAAAEGSAGGGASGSERPGRAPGNIAPPD